MTGDWALPTIDLKRCTGCGVCIGYCPTQAVAMVDRRPVIVRPDDCTYCGECEENCPEGAIGLGYEIVLPHDLNKTRQTD